MDLTFENASWIDWVWGKKCTNTPAPSNMVYTSTNRVYCTVIQHNHGVEIHTIKGQQVWKYVGLYEVIECHHCLFHSKQPLTDIHATSSFHIGRNHTCLMCFVYVCPTKHKHLWRINRHICFISLSQVTDAVTRNSSRFRTTVEWPKPKLI